MQITITSLIHTVQGFIHHHLKFRKLSEQARNLLSRRTVLKAISPRYHRWTVAGKSFVRKIELIYYIELTLN